MHSSMWGDVMSGEANRLDRLESGLRSTQDSILIMGKDIHSLTVSTQSIADSMSVLVKIEQNQAVMEERWETRHVQLKEADKLLHERVDDLEEKVDKRYRELDVISFFSRHPWWTIATGIGLYALAIKEWRDYLMGIGG